MEYFKDTLNDGQEAISYAKPLILINDMDQPFELYELKEVLKTVKDNKAPGIDRIPYEFYRYAPDNFLKYLLKFYNLVLSRETVPESFTRSIIFPLHKKGDLDAAENYRGISFIDCVAKIFTGLLLKRIEEFVENNKILPEAQAGFRKGYSTIDNVFNLMNIIHLKLSKKRGKVYAFFVDLKSAFDTLNRQALLYKLSQIGLSTKMINIIEKLYRNTKSAVWVKNNISAFFEVKNGVRQGDVLSAMLFILYILDLPEYIGGGIKIENFVVPCLLFADDIVLLSESKYALQKMINKLAEYCSIWSLSVNLTKSKIMVFRNGGRLSKNESWHYKGEAIEVKSEYKYLGLTLSSNMSFRKHFEKKVPVAMRGIHATWRSFIVKKEVPISAKMQVFEAVIRAVLCYGAQVWGGKRYDKVEQVQRSFIKRIFCLPRSTPNYALYLETGRPSIFLHTLRLHLKFILKTLNSPQHRLTKRLADIVVRNKIAWYKDISELCVTAGCQPDDFFSTTSTRADNAVSIVLNNIESQEREKLFERLAKAEFHSTYKLLKFDHEQLSYINDTNSLQMVGIIMRARTETLNLNRKPWSTDESALCSLCNLQQPEDILHFLAICPILSEIRLQVFSVSKLSYQQAIDYLNGANYRQLYLYAKEALTFKFDYS